MKSSFLFLVVSTIAITGFHVLAQNDVSLRTRSECIAAAQLNWHNSEADQVKVLNQIGDIFGAIQSFPIGGQSIREHQRIYVIFTDNCAMKNSMLDEIMTIYLKEIPDFPSYEIIEAPIEPSPATIDTFGPEWLDG